MKIPWPKLDTSHLSPNDAALLRRQYALDLRDQSNYEGARKVMLPLWKNIGDEPNVKGLDPSAAAEVYLCVGILTSWIGSREGIEKSQETAKNLIGRAIRIFESLGDSLKVAESQAEIAYCYLREGGLDEARIMLTEAVQKLSPQGNTKARALLKLAIVEWSASRYNVAHEILTNNASLFKRITNHITLGTYHNELAIVLRHLAEWEPLNREKHLQQAIGEFKTAATYFRLGKNKVFGACVKNNLGLLLLNLGRFKDAHKTLEEARRLSVSTKNKVQTAVIDESRAQVLIAENKLKAAEEVARRSVHVLEKSGHQGHLTESLITHGVALARLGKSQQALVTLERAYATGQQAGALNKAGLAALTIIEELDEAPTQALSLAFDRASEWLPSPKSDELGPRLNAAARKLFARLSGSAELDCEALEIKTFNFFEEVHRLEENLIRNKLSEANGKITTAAKRMGMSYQGLAYMIKNRHPALLKERTPVRSRSHKKTIQSQHANNDLR
jgi:tetratricopeptide (TPR) repeat protein